MNFNYKIVNLIIIALGLGITPLWKIVGQVLDTNKKPHELRIKIKADRGAKYPCPVLKVQ